MSLRFDKDAARQLAKEMGEFAQKLIQARQEIQRICNQSSGWKDDQKKELERCLDALNSGTDSIIRAQGTYQAYLLKKIRELNEV